MDQLSQFEKNHTVEEINHNSGKKNRRKQLQAMVIQINRQLDERNSYQQDDSNILLSNLSKISGIICNIDEHTIKKEYQYEIKMNKVDKDIRRNLAKIIKDREQVNTYLSKCLEKYVLELTSFISKGQSACLRSIQKLLMLQSCIDSVSRDIQDQQQSILTKQIFKKISVQYTQQMRQILNIISNEQMKVQKQSEYLINKIQNMYAMCSQKCEQNKQNRLKSNESMVNLLQNIINKVKNELQFE